MVSFLYWQKMTNALSCDVKQVCVDEKHVGLQASDCKITSLENLVKSSKAFCVTGCKDGKCVDDGKIATCIDSDKDNNYYLKGSSTLVSLGAYGQWIDSCIDANTLNEVSCKKKKTIYVEGTKYVDSEKDKFGLAGEEYKCPIGCLNGACVKSYNSTKCEDSDGGKEVMKPGLIKINGKVIARDALDFDYRKIREYFCKPDNTYGSELFTCPGSADLNSVGAFCLKDCQKEMGWKCINDKSRYSIAFISKDCKQTRKVECESNACSRKLCASNLATKKIDTDGDGLLDVTEKKYGTNPKKFDTDLDGFGDKEEIISGFNPLGKGKLKIKK